MFLVMNLCFVTHFTLLFLQFFFIVSSTLKLSLNELKNIYKIFYPLEYHVLQQ